MSETIVALSSGALPSGVAVVRISGPAAKLAITTLAGSLPPARRASLRTLRSHDGEPIDRCLVILFDGPATATGEDLAEFHLHGGRAVVSACLEALTRLPGIRLAEAGEFTRRAFENGRIDLTEAEGLAELLSAETEAQRGQSLAQSGGALRRVYEDWMRRLIQARAHLEASFDFSDEGDVSADVASSVRPMMCQLIEEMDAHLASARRGEILRDGFKVVIAGPPNAGKSSLLNALAERDVAIVSDRPGTTRDLIEVRLDLGGLPVRITDTAGLRETEDEIERHGIARAEQAMAEADLVLLLDDDRALDLTHVKQGVPTLHLRGKADLDPAQADNGRLAVSAKTSTGLDRLILAITEAARDAAGDPSAVVPTRVRHREIVSAARAILADALLSRDAEEVLAEDLRRATDRLGMLTGRVGVEDLLDVIFSEFCIGK
ncbi:MULTISPECIES: tRNA uridine-5-carboxymethylaminomethyl(34) synthesis GTPase MnmE [unclassified Aureimonas]|uniref:tRNA uridine-5-carboxymethylaminomethyl(34) synthesis GTPase MnmE n=1 Tax=unclassified Aureimonas TaxID=2615206 RepID=UPI0006FB930A|nr:MULTISPECIES: tRNA uridine-5-carboxymethylaminomethyl(34) synthesis GTPase MnmE [unclassified Aureimonas]KQT52586.1 tRNA modification GTPase TrmE [Aureimonas sp. Leaf427]KQT77513.1 tRNA modification GTPase TrmE [Aureimonas sp. Leaf460]